MPAGVSCEDNIASAEKCGLAQYRRGLLLHRLVDFQEGERRRESERERERE